MPNAPVASSSKLDKCYEIRDSKSVHSKTNALPGSQSYGRCSAECETQTYRCAWNKRTGYSCMRCECGAQYYLQFQTKKLFFHGVAVSSIQGSVVSGFYIEGPDLKMPTPHPPSHTDKPPVILQNQRCISDCRQKIGSMFGHILNGEQTSYGLHSTEKCFHRHTLSLWSD